MRLAKFRDVHGASRVALLDDELLRPLELSAGQYRSLFDVLEAEDPAAAARFLVDPASEPLPLASAVLLPPLDRQEVWAAGVTYRRSRTARMQESTGAAWCYDKVYEAPRPELFFKASPHRVVGPHQPVRIRSDARWNVPEPELALVLNSRLRLVAFTIGNDMSARDIEGENPLYLPQAKLYDGCCALGPCLTLRPWLSDADETPIELVVRRAGEIVFQGQTNTDQMARTFQDLTDWLARDNTFPQGVILLTGTGIVPPDEFSLQRDDEVTITIPGIGTLVNPVVQG